MFASYIRLDHMVKALAGIYCASLLALGIKMAFLAMLILVFYNWSEYETAGFNFECICQRTLPCRQFEAFEHPACVLWDGGLAGTAYHCVSARTKYACEKGLCGAGHNLPCDTMRLLRGPEGLPDASEDGAIKAWPIMGSFEK